MSRLFSSFFVAAMLAGLCSGAAAQTPESLRFSIEAYDKALAALADGEQTVAIGDMLFKASQIKAWRDQFQDILDGKISAQGGFDFSSAKPWTDGVVPYRYDSSVPENVKTLFEAALREWQEHASLNFVQRSSQANYILIKFTGYESDAPMNSWVGMIGKGQELNVAGWGNKIDCAHELGHALGMAHEQCRSDRDTFVTIIASNLTVNPATDVNYAIVPSSINRTAYDYDSLMHYPRNAFAVDGRANLLAKSPNEAWSDGLGPQEIGQKTHLSSGDKAAMAGQYGAPLTLGGRIVDAAGRPLAGIAVALSGGSTYRGPNPVVTDGDGRYTFTGIPKNSGTYTVTPNQPGTSFTQSSRQGTVRTASLGTLDFTSVDAAPPDLHIDIPAVSGVYSSLPQVTGTASDAVGLKEVRVALARTSDLVWWNWQENNWGSTTFDWAKNVRIANGGASWSAALPTLPVGGYQVHVQSVDLSDNASPWLFRHFFIDPEPPYVAVTQPVPNSVVPALERISGVATDGAGTGIKDGKVYFTLYHDGKFWTGFHWKGNTDAQDPDVLLSADVVAGQWAYNGLSAHDHGEPSHSGHEPMRGTYYVSLFARDNAGNLSVPAAGVNSVEFTIDDTPPSVAITYPEDGLTVTTNLSAITGTATDTKSLESVRLYLYRYSDGQFWDGTAWGGGGSAILPVAIDTENGTWRSTGPLPLATSRNPSNRLSNGGYNVIAFAEDAAGNQMRIDSVITVEYYATSVYTAGSYSDSDPNNNNELWDNPANWNPYGVPGSEEIAVVNSGSPEITGTKTVHGLKLAGGNLRGGGIVIPEGGTMTWSGGTLSADLTVDAGGMLLFNTTADKALASGKILENNGAIEWKDAGAFRASGASVFRNKGSMAVAASLHLYHYNNGVYPAATFENLGILTKNGPDDLVFPSDYGGWILTNGNAIEINGGRVVLNNTTYLGGTVSGAGSLRSEGATVHLDGTATIDGGTFDLNSGTLHGGGTFTGNGTFAWSGGTVAGDILIDTSATMQMSGGMKIIASGARIRNAGHTIWSEGNLHCSGQSRFENTGEVDITGAVAAYHYNNGVYPRSEFTNNGLVRKSGAGTVVFANDYGGMYFHNNGELRVSEGLVRLGGGGSSTNAIFTISAGAEIKMDAADDHAFTGEIQLTGGGTLSVDGARLTGNAAELDVAASTKFQLARGTINGTLAIAGPGMFEWSGGTLNAAVDWLETLTVAITSDEQKNLEAGRINQRAQVSWTGGGDIRSSGGAEIRNTGLFHAQSDARFLHYNNGIYPAGTFFNAGTFRKSNSAGKTLFAPDYGGWIFNNTGIVDIQSGTVEFENQSVTFAHGGRLTGAAAARIIAGTTTFEGTNTVDTGTIELKSGTVASAGGRIAGAGVFRWSGGTIQGSITFALPAFHIEGADGKVLSSGSTIRNEGEAFWSGTGTFHVSGQSYFENMGRFEAQNDAIFYYYNNGAYPKAAFINAGEFVKSGGTNVTDFSQDYGGAAFNNTGSVLVGAGTLKLAGGGFWDGGSITVQAGSGLQLAAGDFELTNSIPFIGTTRVTGGNMILRQGTNVIAAGSTVALENGSLTGTGGFDGPGVFEWRGGTIAGAVTISKTTLWNLGGEAEKRFATGTINHHGRATWSGTGPFKSEGAALLNNYGSFEILNDGQFTYYNNGVYPRGQFSNFGVLSKKGSPGVAVFTRDYTGWVFRNEGTLQIDSGLLVLAEESVLTNSTIRGAGAVQIKNGQTMVQGTTRIDGTFELAGGALNGDSTHAGTGLFRWTGGELRGVQRIAAGARLEISGTEEKNIAGSSTLINDGTATWTGGRIRGVGQSRLVNHGTFIAAGDAAFSYYNNGVYPEALVENEGVIRKESSTGATSFDDSYGGWNFANNGALDIQSGVFDVGARYEPGANASVTVLIGGAEAGTGYSRLAFRGAANLGGTLAVRLAEGYVPDTNYMVVTYGSASSQFASPALPVLTGGRAWQLNYKPEGLELSIASATTNENPIRTGDGKFQLSLNGPAGSYALFQCTTNLVEWTNLATNQPFNGTFTFSDPGATNSSKFYRTVIVP